ncbi:MAG TPA: hypothetical protein VG297_01185 [Bryobacteraceae bacterium]|nr:hypothetical protein [Bryobacteraceae bacterium]
MKSVLAFGVISLLAVAPAFAQFGARSGALGGGFASRGMSRPLGGIPGPGFTTGLNSRGNFVGRNGSVRGGTRRPATGYPYAYSIWVPDSFDYLSYQNQYPPAYYDPGYGAPPPAPGYDNGYNTPPPGPQQPVIINQYFNSPPPGSQPAPSASGAASPTGDARPGDLLATPQNYYLIAFKDHSVYPALAYWVEDKTLHYVTTQNTHNQASLDLVDIARSKSLNQDRDVPFSITAQ